METTQLPDILAGKENIIDVLVRDQSGAKYIIEMQVNKEYGFEKQAQYYVAKTYCEGFKVKGDYADLNKIVFLAILNHNLFPKKQDCKSIHKILYTKSLENDLQDFTFVFIEAKKFNKTESELISIEDKWLYFFKNAKTIGSVWEYFSQQIGVESIKEAYHVLDSILWTEADSRIYERILLNELKGEGVITAAIQDALEEGAAKGKAEGKAEGIEEAKIKIAKEMLKKGIDIATVSECSGLSEVDILKLKN